MNFQRNGVGGEPFFVATFSKLDDGTKGNFVATFEVDNADKQINSSTCRVVEVGNPYESWRGDNIASQIQKAFEATGMKGYYDMVTALRESAKGTMYYKKPSERTAIKTATN